MTPNQIEFRTTSNSIGTWVLRITSDRRIEVNEDVEVTDAAQKVLEAIQHLLPQRTWVGLTDEDIERGCNSSWVDRQAFESAVWWAEAKLKEKNDKN